MNECISDVCLLEVVKREKKEAEEKKNENLTYLYLLNIMLGLK